MDFFNDYGGKECCIFDSASGKYNIPRIIRLALKYTNVKISEITDTTTDEEIIELEFVDEVIMDCEYALSKLLPENYFCGSNENADWGIWQIPTTEESLKVTQPLLGNNDITYKGRTIRRNFPGNGMYEIYSDLEKRFLRFDTLKGVKDKIREESSKQKSN